jgi:hypothetical protein
VKNKFFYIVMLLLCLTTGVQDLLAQQPGINLEAIAKDRNNNPAKNRRIHVQVEIIPSSSSNIAAYTEEHIAQTTDAGIFRISIGKGSRVGGSYTNLYDIPWGTFDYVVRIKIAIEPLVNIFSWNYHNEWIDLGTTPFGIVPFAVAALWAKYVDDSAAVISFSGGATGLTPASPSRGNVVLGGILNIQNGGTGSSVKNFVDLSTLQNIGGEKKFTQLLTADAGISISNSLALTGSNSPIKLNGSSGNNGDVLMSQGANATPIWVNLSQLSGIKSKNRSTQLTGVDTYDISVTGLDNNDGISVVLEAGSVSTQVPSYYVYRDIPNNKVIVHFTAPYSGFVTWVIVD